MQLFRPRANTFLRVGLAALVLVPAGTLVLIGLVVRSSFVTGVGANVVQPVPFSHEHHVGGLGIDCRYCHASVERSAFAGMPSTETCMTCHSQLWTSADMLAPVRRSLADGEPLRWNRVHDLPDFVFFDHAVHVANGVGCTSCHGQVDEMPLVRKAHSLEMFWCLDCHRDPYPHLRPPDAIFATDWKPPKDAAASGRELAELYGIDESGRLTDCSKCHR